MFLKQSTSAVVLVGPVLDASGVAVTTAVIGDFTLTKNGTSAALSGNTISHSHNGHYAITLTTANTDTIGRLTISTNNASYAMPVFRWDICQPTVYDALFTNAVNTSGGLPAATGSISALAGAISTLTAGGVRTELATELGRIDAAVSSRSTLTAGGVRTELATELGRIDVTVSSRLATSGYTAPLDASGTAAAVWNTLLASYTVSASFGDRIVRSANTNNQVFLTGGNTPHIAADVHAFQTDAITADALAASAVTKIQSGLATSANQTTILNRLGAFTGSGVNTVLGFLKAIMSKAASTPSDVGGTFAASTDAIEAIRDAQQAGTGDASQATLEAVQDTVDAIAAAISGTSINVISRVADGGAITLYAGDDARVRSGTEIAVSISDVGGAIYSRLNTIGLANLAFGASRPSQPAGAIQGTVAALTVVGAGASQTLRIDLEIEDAGERLAWADNYVWQIVSSTAQGSEYDTWTEVEGTLAVRRRVAVPVYS